jgi:DNA-binding beta-propeller fold protein YncE
MTGDLTMKKSLSILFMLMMFFTFRAKSEPASSLKLVRTIPMPGITGRFDAFGVDVKGHRLFVTPLDHKTVEVYDLTTGKLIHSIPGMEKAHAVLYRGDLNEIFVTDGPAESLKIFKGDRYALIKAVKPLAEPDGILYDPATHYLYIITGGENAKLDYSLIAVVDTDRSEHIGDIRIEGGTMEEMRLEKSSPRLFVVNREKNRIEVLDRKERTILTSWPITLGKVPVGLAIDESAHRLFVGCRSEVMVVVDSESGKEITSVPLSKGIDGMVFDPASRRIYSEANTGAIDVYEETDADHYRSLGTTAIGSPAKPGLLVPELNRYFVAAPQHDTADAAILEYKVR